VRLSRSCCFRFSLRLPSLTLRVGRQLRLASHWISETGKTARQTALVLLLLAGCTSEQAKENETVDVPTAAVAQIPRLPTIELDEFVEPDPAHSELLSPRLVDRHRDLGVLFTFETGADDRALMVQSTGGGGGWIDFDRDGWQDLFLVQGGNPTASPPHPIGDRLWRSRAGCSFADVSEQSLPGDSHYGQGMAVGDFDHDGFEDIFISNVGADVLLHNQGDGTFSDITEATGMADPRWGASATWFDLDEDGDLDLFVCNYCRYDVFHPVVCRKDDGSPAICHPESLDGDLSECYENLGDGSFAPVAQLKGLAVKPGKALGVVAADFNEDGHPDLFVTNDTMANSLYLGQESGGFLEQAVSLGCAYNTLGQYQANMGIACQDYDGNGFLDLYVTTFTHDSNTLFANLGAAGFRDVTRLEGLHGPTIDTLGFGTVMTDLNADGAMDLFNTNGHIDDWRYKNEMWKMPPELFTYVQGNWVQHTAETVGEYLQEEHLGRAVSMADFDRDGDTDLLVMHQNEPAAILENESVLGNWLGIEFLGIRSNRRGIGAHVTVRQGSRTWTLQLIGGSSYLTTHEPALFFGLGESSEPCEITVRWPVAGSLPTTRTVAANQRVLMVESPALLP